MCTDKINNIITDVLILTNSKFIENRVYEEDIKEIAPSKPLPFKKEDQSNFEQVAIEKLKHSIQCGMNCLYQRYNLSADDIDAPFDRNNLLSTLLVHKNRFSTKPLPYLIGSELFSKDTFVGLKVENDSPVIVFNRNTAGIDACNFNDDNSLDSNDSSGSFHFETNLVSQQEESAENIPSEVHQNRPVQYNPIRNSDFEFDDDDIFSEKLVSPSKTNHQQASDSLSKAVSSASKETIIPKVIEESIGIRKKNLDFFDDISNDDSDDDLFAKRSTNEPSKSENPPEFVTKINTSSSNTTSNANHVVDPMLNQSSLLPSQNNIAKVRLDSIFSSDEEEDVNIFNVSISKPLTGQLKSVPNINVFSSDEEDEDLFGPLKKVDTKPEPIKAVTTAPDALKGPTRLVSAKVPFMSNVISELNDALKNKNVEKSDASSEDEFDKLLEVEKSPIKVQSTESPLTTAKIMESKVENEKSTAKFSAFSSDDDDDLFSHPENTESKSVSNKALKEADVQLPTTSMKSTKPPTLSPNASPVHMEQTNSVKTPAMYNAIAELGASLTNKNEVVTNKNKSHKKIKPESATLPGDSKDVPVKSNNSSHNDSFNDMLKHKAKLNSRRNRKRPSMKPREQKIFSNDSHLAIASEILKAQTETPQPLLLPKDNTRSSAPSKATISSDDDSESDLFVSKSAGNVVGLQQPEKANILASAIIKPTISSGQVLSNVSATKAKFLDSSDDTDDDIFSKPFVTQAQTDRSPTAIGVKMSNSLFNDSDDDGEDFLSASLSRMAPLSKKETPTSNKVPKKSLDAKKSIFDEDSDSDGKQQNIF